VSTRNSAVALEEDTELRELRDRADRTTAEAARTLAELTARLAAARDPGAMARRLTARTRDVATRAFREGPGRLADQRGARRTALAAIPVLAVAAAVIVAYRRGYLPPGSPRLPSLAPGGRERWAAGIPLSRVTAGA